MFFWLKKSHVHLFILKNKVLLPVLIAGFLFFQAYFDEEKKAIKADWTSLFQNSPHFCDFFFVLFYVLYHLYHDHIALIAGLRIRIHCLRMDQDFNIGQAFLEKSLGSKSNPEGQNTTFC